MGDDGAEDDLVVRPVVEDLEVDCAGNFTASAGMSHKIAH
jgi:hypothetical protein